MIPDIVRVEALALLEGHGAHMTFDEAVAEFPAEAMNERPPNVDYTPWQLLEHIRLTQRDILDYVTRPNDYAEPRWPEGYWPSPDAMAGPDDIARTLAAIRDDREALVALVVDQAVDLLAPLPHTPGHTLLREVRLVADHTAYHVGEFAILRQVMGTWPAARPG